MLFTRIHVLSRESLQMMRCINCVKRGMFLLLNWYWRVVMWTPALRTMLPFLLPVFRKMMRWCRPFWRILESDCPWWQWAYYRYYTDSNARCLDYGSRFTMAFAQVALDGLRKIMSMLGLEHLSNQYLWTATFCWTFLFIIFAYFCSVYRFGFGSYSLRGCSVVMGLLVSFGLL
ncbi:hypothetical protein BDR26DRAFT_854553, partial [Obelidium mucronatum]